LGSTDANNAESETIGLVVDKRYRITGVLGRGGMGNVYRAEHVTIKRPVALKLLIPSLGHLDHIKARFEREAFAAGRVDHPNCVTASDFGELEDGTRYLVMELLDGESLADVVEREAPLTVDRSLHIVRHLLHGLRFAHKAGVIHRDLKPDNVILDTKDGDENFARLLDFGIAKLLGDAQAEEGGAQLTQAGVAFGTPTYMSPEQAYGETVDARSDLYALSVMLYEMLTGRPPFINEDKMAVLNMHASRPPPPFSEVVPDLSFPPGVESLVRRGLEKPRDARFADAGEYIDAIVSLMPQWATDAIWSERTPTAMRKVSVPAPGERRHVVTTASPVPPPPSVDQPHSVRVSAGMPSQALPQARRGLSKLELGLVIGLSMLAFMFIMLVATGGDDPPDQFALLTNELATADTCEERKQAVVELRELGDRRAIEPLRKARDRKAKRGTPQSNRCLRKDAIAAIRTLQKLPAAKKTTPE